MPLIEYVTKRFSAESQRIIDHAIEICDDYRNQGYALTLRQLYYQFVARDLIKNEQKEYKRLGSIINDARLAGLLDWEMIEDRTRSLESQPTWDSPKNILEACAQQFKYDLWEDQQVRIEIWVEKEALAGVIERIAFKHRCAFFCCRGYTSQSEAWRAGQRLQSYVDGGQPVKVIHLGDHDPSGIDMTRDNRDRLLLFSEHSDIEVIRVALNEDQVRRYRPPPNPAKLEDSRATSYIQRFGDKSWELDALSPATLDQIITDEVESWIDTDAWEASLAREEKARKRIADMAKKWKE